MTCIMQNGHLAWERGSLYIFIEEGRGQRFLILRMVLLITLGLDIELNLPFGLSTSLIVPIDNSKKVHAKMYAEESSCKNVCGYYKWY